MKSGKHFIFGLCALLFLASAAFGQTFPILRQLDLVFPRTGHTATELRDHRILVAGGENTTGVLSSVEILVPVMPGSSVPRPMLSPRAYHAACLLPDNFGGGVLITGGRDGRGNVLATSEIFDPQYSTFIQDGTMNFARFGHTATSLADGKILIIGGDEDGTVELFDPERRSYSPLMPLNVPRRFHSAIRLNSGKILIVGGTAPDGTPLLSAEVIDLAEPMATPVHNGLSEARVRPDLRLLPDGKVLVVGGNSHKTFEVFDPAWNVFKAAVPALAAGHHPLEILGSGTRAVLFGGYYAPGTLPVDVGQLLDRTGQSLTEVGLYRVAFVAGGTDAAGLALSSAFWLQTHPASVTTSYADYVAGESVSITGRGWSPGETVSLNILGIAGGDQVLASATADAGGNFSCEGLEFLVIDQGSSYLLTARGSSTPYLGQTSFQVSPPLLDMEIQPAPPTFPGGSSEFQITLHRWDLPEEPFDAILTVLGPPEGPSMPPDTEFSLPLPVLHFEAGMPSSSIILSVNTSSSTPLGEYPFSIKAYRIDDPGIHIVGTGILVVEPEFLPPVIVSPPVDATRTVGDSVTFSVVVESTDPLSYQWVKRESGLIPGATEASFTIAYVTSSDVGNYYVEVSSAGGSARSEIAALVVNKALPEIVWDYPPAIRSGIPLDGAVLNAEARFLGNPVNGEFVYSSPAGTVFPPGPLAIEAFFTPQDQNNYQACSTVAMIEAHPVSPQIFWPRPADIACGIPLGSTQLNAQALYDGETVTGSFQYDPPSGHVLGPGIDQTLTVHFFPDNQETYTPVSASTLITVIQAVPAVNWPGPEAILYGTPLGDGQLNATADVPGTFVYTPAAGTILNAGSGQTLHADFVPEDPAAYAAASLDVAIDVIPAPLIVKADDKSKPYGSALPDLTVSYTGFVAGQGPDVLEGTLVLTPSADSTSPVGTYPIIPSGQISSNYNVTFENGLLSITPAPLTIKAENSVKVLAAPLPSFTASFSGFVNGEGSGVLAGVLAFQTAATPASPVGSYPITPSGLTSGNYEIIWLDGNLSIVYADSNAFPGGHMILPPIKMEGTSVFKRGSTVPAKFRVFDANGVSIGSPGVVSSFRLVQVIAGTASDVDEEVYSTTPDAAFRWSPDEELWIFNISTKNLAANQTYIYRITLNDGSIIEFQFGLK